MEERKKVKTDRNGNELLNLSRWRSQSSEEENWFMKIRNCDDYYLAIHSILHWSHRFHHEEETIYKKEKERKIEKEGTLEGLKRN